MKIDRIRGDCPDAYSCPARYATDRASSIFVGPQVTDPDDLAQLAIGPGEAAVEVPAHIAPEPLLLDAAGLGAFLDRAQHDLFRLEARDSYDVATDGGDFHRYVRGEPGPDPARKQPWLDRLAADREAGLQHRRVHVLRSPIGDYLRYEAEWGYAFNTQAGEEIRILDTADMPCPGRLLLDDYWVADGRDVVLMHYDAAGRFLAASVLAPEAIGIYGAAAAEAWDVARPFEVWWAAHPEYHRRAA
jgi:hypothetical protein